jgi:hypothetical protein
MTIKSGIHFSEGKAENIISLLYNAHGMTAVDVYAQWVGLPYGYCGECDQQTPFQTGGQDPNILQGPCNCYVCGNRENF